MALWAARCSLTICAWQSKLSAALQRASPRLKTKELPDYQFPA
jgi:hypothetical protein